ncbi:MAG TPA: hypothetical protein VMI75_15520 [Polyangiaceae bacterium]|nr:hypothetical protein [Polyangiaceae bacterium]
MIRRLLLLAIAALSCGKPIGGSQSTGRGARVDIDECWSGQMLEFRGVELFHDPDTARRVRVVEDPVAGSRVVLLGIVPGRARVIVDADSCATFDSHVQSGNSTLNDIRSVRGSLELACSIASVGVVTAHVTFSDCSFDNRAQQL